MTYHVDRFYAAAAVLAAEGHIKHRLIRAYTDNLANIEDDELPIALQETFADLKRRMHGVAPLNGEGPIRASVRKMSPAEAGECGVMVLSLFGDMLRHGDSSGDIASLQDSDGKAVPPFLVKSMP